MNKLRPTTISIKNHGFTIVELLIVIVIIAVLASITVVAFNGVTDRANESTLKSDLSNAAKKFQMFNAINGRYPNTVAEYKGLDVEFSFTPAGSKVLLCANSDGYAIFAYHPGSDSERYWISPKGIASANGVSWSSAALCATTPYPSAAWGSYWVTGG